jgi:hypothetical protein
MRNLNPFSGIEIQFFNPTSAHGSQKTSSLLLKQQLAFDFPDIAWKYREEAIEQFCRGKVHPRLRFGGQKYWGSLLKFSGQQYTSGHRKEVRSRI